MHGGTAINLYMLDSFRLRMISDRARGAVFATSRYCLYFKIML